jgi:hypothetical protein
MEKIKNYLPYVTLVLVLFTLIRSCGTGSELSRMNKNVNQRLDSIEQSTVNKKELEEVLKNTPMWKTLEIEELSDKEHMPINHYKNEEEKN